MRAKCRHFLTVAVTIVAGTAWGLFPLTIHWILLAAKKEGEPQMGSRTLQVVATISTTLILVFTPGAAATEVSLTFDNNPAVIIFEIGSTSDSITTVPASITWYDSSITPATGWSFVPNNATRVSVGPGPLWTFWANGGNSDEFIFEDFGRTADILNVNTWDDLIALGTITAGTGPRTKAYMEYTVPGQSQRTKGTYVAPLSFQVVASEKCECPPDVTQSICEELYAGAFGTTSTEDLSELIRLRIEAAAPDSCLQDEIDQCVADFLTTIGL